MYDGVAKAIEGIVFMALFGVVSAIFLAIYVLWQSFFGFTPWEVCVKMETDKAIVQCMEAHSN